MKLDRTKLQRARELLGYGIETTAEKAGVSKNSVLRAEHEEDIRPVTARKIAGALKVEVRDLLPLDQEPLPNFVEPVLARLERSPQEEQFRNHYERIKELSSKELGALLDDLREQHARIYAELQQAVKEDASSPATTSLYSQVSMLSGYALITRLQKQIVDNPGAAFERAEAEQGLKAFGVAA